MTFVPSASELPSYTGIITATKVASRSRLRGAVLCCLKNGGWVNTPVQGYSGRVRRRRRWHREILAQRARNGDGIHSEPRWCT